MSTATAPDTETGSTAAPSPTGTKSSDSGWFVRIAVIAIVAIWLVPTVGLFISSFRTREYINAEGWWTAFVRPFAENQWTIDNYATVLGQARGFGAAFVNSLAVTIPATIIPITIALFAAYAFSWMQFKGRYLLFVGVVALIAVPLHVALIPVLRLYQSGMEVFGITIFPALQLQGSFPAMWLAHTGFGLPLAIYLLRNYVGSLPSSIIESARVDGASHMQIFTRLIVPLSVPAIAAFATLQFLWVWNDLLVALVFLGGTPDVRVLQVALADLQGAFGQNRHILPAAAFVTMALPMVVFFSLQRFFVRGLTAGAVKG
ncbi:carbohydrate ABC transporter permease [Egicoccus halophilus]|uniref:Sugar ABC transporter permease n=1 Tax=Egicoccus halophilus TaxID=1670830 RepID=A0A8J3A8N7_9ACTN|nr:carbohydrate ABC transporter permease [Egicoccus halophilus]GGI06741.1 sugar ABC transporter permease [Egicoccus halophilus]